MLGKIVKIEQSDYSNNDLTKMWYNITYKSITGKTVTILDAFNNKPDYLLGKYRFTNNKISWIETFQEKYLFRYKYHYCAFKNNNYVDGIVFRTTKIKSMEDYHSVKQDINKKFCLSDDYKKITISSITRL